jgi:hypothetical protein
LQLVGQVIPAASVSHRLLKQIVRTSSVEMDWHTRQVTQEGSVVGNDNEEPCAGDENMEENLNKRTAQ